MRAEFLPFSRPSITEDDISAVADVLRSGWITTGPNVVEFERRFCEYVGCKNGNEDSANMSVARMALHSLRQPPGCISP